MCLCVTQTQTHTNREREREREREYSKNEYTITRKKLKTKQKDTLNIVCMYNLDVGKENSRKKESSFVSLVDLSTYTTQTQSDGSSSPF